ncbi:MAG: glycosyltransferase family 4 protein, partial [Bdellovibrio sp.]|nr:glycosyltransferase family 4 protein [Bdellovibrio sp.]
LTDNIKDRIQLLVVCLSHAWGGLEHVAVGDALECGSLGLKVSFLCAEGSPVHEYLAHRKELKVLPLSFMPRNLFDLSLRKELHHYFAEGINFIHTHQTAYLGSILPWMWGYPHIPVFATRHILSNHRKKNPFHHLLYKRLDLMLVVSQGIRQNILQTHPLKESKVKVINLGLDYNRFDPEKVNAREQRKKWDANDNTLMIGLVGRIDPAKGQETFIKAAAGLMKNIRRSENLKFVIVGEETLGRTKGYLAQLKEMVSQFSLNDYFIFAGYQKNIPEIMRAFDILVMPSRQEAFGLVSIEAMAMECPIVISSGGSAYEIVGAEQEYGLLVRPEDPFDLQKKLRFLIDNPIERAEMGHRARQFVVQHYDRNVRVLRHLELYDWGLNKRGI